MVAKAVTSPAGAGTHPPSGSGVPDMVRVVLESPFAGGTETNIAYARAAVSDSLHRGEAPIASHLLHTQPGILNDTIPAERALGIDAGHAWFHAANKVVVYTNLGISAGMQLGIDRATSLGLPIEYRTIIWGTA